MLTLGSQVEVRCHSGCPWTAGWEIADVVPGLGETQYRVRLQGQTRALAALLPEADVRPVRELVISAN
jgi:hypothetical protein